MTARSLPLFPLPVVLFPGVTLPLHIFEPRYRRMVADCMEGDRQFVLANLPDGVAERELPSGWVACLAAIEQVQMLPDGRSNISVSGVARVALERFEDATAPYHVVVVRDYDDEEGGGAGAEALAAEVRELFEQVAAAARTLSEDRRTLPDLPADAMLLAYRIAAMIDLDLATRQRLLESRSLSERLRTLRDLLEKARAPLEQRAAVHVLAKRNGHGPLGH